MGLNSRDYVPSRPLALRLRVPTRPPHFCTAAHDELASHRTCRSATPRSPLPTFDAFPRSLSQTLTGDVKAAVPKAIVVPPWQRSYSWRATEIDQFWTDIVSFSEDCPKDGTFG